MSVRSRVRESLHVRDYQRCADTRQLLRRHAHAHTLSVSALRRSRPPEGANHMQVPPLANCMPSVFIVFWLWPILACVRAWVCVCVCVWTCVSLCGQACVVVRAGPERAQEEERGEMLGEGWTEKWMPRQEIRVSSELGVTAACNTHTHTHTHTHN